MSQTLFENKDFIIINKPSGCTMHASSASAYPTVSQLIQQQSNLDLSQFHIVHRLDDETSGCLVLAKHTQSAATLGELFERKLIQKVYVGLSQYKGKRKQGWVKGHMQKSRDGNYKLTRNTHNMAVSYFFRRPFQPGLYAYWVQPFTGKTHQIRVACKSNSSPLLGDKRYGDKQQDAERMYLHAYSLQFLWEGQAIDVSCPAHQGQYFTEHASTLLAQYEALKLHWPQLNTPPHSVSQ